jgi:hypothetical protein
MRATHLLQSQIAELEAWGQRLRTMFHGEMPYLVGSSLTTGNWRDIDVRVMLDDDAYDALKLLVVPSQLNLAVSVWGQKVTGLPIDFQVQRMTEANEEFHGRRHPLAMRSCTTPPEVTP